MSMLFEGNEHVLPIYNHDTMQIGFDYQYLMDICVANATYGKGKAKNPDYTIEDALRDTLRETIDMIVRETWDEFDLCKAEMIRELKNRYEGE